MKLPSLILYFNLVVLLVILSSSICAYAFEYSLETAYPDTQPYYLGTQVKSIKVWLLEDNEKIDVNANFIDLRIGKDVLRLNKKDKIFSTNDNFYITKDNITSGNMILEVITPIPNVINKNVSYKIEDPAKYITLELLDLKENYNIAQTVDLNISFKYVVNDLALPTCYSLNLTQKNNLFTCAGTKCTKSIKIPNDANVEYNLNIFCYTKKGESLIPLYINKTLKITNDLILTITNPDSKGIVNNPLFMNFRLEYPNGLKLDTRLIEIYANDRSKSITHLENGEYQINELFIPYTDFNKQIKIVYNGNTYFKEVRYSLKPASWFWITVVVILLIILMNLVFLIIKLFKKEDVNQLIAERNLYVDKLSNMKKEYLGAKMTKSSYDEFTKDYEFKIAYLNSKIIKLKKLSPEDQYKQIKRSIQTPEMKETPKPDDLLKALKTKQPEIVKPEEVNINVKPIQSLEIKQIETKPEIQDKGIEKKPGFFEKLFTKKEKVPETLEDKLAEVKKILPKSNNDNNDEVDLDINTWKK